MCLLQKCVSGYDTGPQPSNQKVAGMPHEYQASFMKYFDKKDEGAGGSPRVNPGPGSKGGGINIRNYFPNLPSNMDFKEYVSCLQVIHLLSTFTVVKNIAIE